MNLQAQGLSRRIGPTRLGALVVVGGRGGVGATTVALALAGALSSAGRRPLVVDRSDGPGDAALRLGLGAVELAAAQEAPHVASAGLHVLRVGPPLGARALAERLAELEAAGFEAVIDAGPASDPAALELLAWSALGVVVTTDDPAAVAGAYGALKGAARLASGAAHLALAVNRVPSEAAGRRVEAGLLQVARRFLGLEVVGLGVVPEQPAVATAARLSLRGLAPPSAGASPLRGLAVRTLSRLSPQRALRAQEFIA